LKTYVIETIETTGVRLGDWARFEFVETCLLMSSCKPMLLETIEIGGRSKDWTGFRFVRTSILI